VEGSRHESRQANKRNNNMRSLRVLLCLCCLAGAQTLPTTNSPSPARDPLLLLNPQSAKDLPLIVPKAVSEVLRPGKTNYVVLYTVTNRSDQVVRLAGFNATCSCTGVEVSSDSVPTNGTAVVKVTINRAEPTVQGVVLEDDRTNLYQTLVLIRPPK
jgi:hypothetical protein